jgi:signal transduction histidine kinase
MDFNAMAGHIERSEKERRMTTAAIAHELRTPLTVMRGRLQGMLDGLFETNRQEVSRLIGQTDLLARIVEDLRTVTLAEAGRLELRKEAVELRALAAESIEMMSPRLASSGLRVELHGTPVLVQADRHRLTQVICAFLDNAVRYAPHTDVVDISVGSDAGMARIAVADRGPGLPEGTTELAFNGFWRAEESRSRASGGSGLGLAVVQAIASAHGAKARSHHRDGGGMVFEILIPMGR